MLTAPRRPSDFFAMLSRNLHFPKRPAPLHPAGGFFSRHELRSAQTPPDARTFPNPESRKSPPWKATSFAAVQAGIFHACPNPVYTARALLDTPVFTEYRRCQRRGIIRTSLLLWGGKPESMFRQRQRDPAPRRKRTTSKNGTLSHFYLLQIRAELS